MRISTSIRVLAPTILAALLTGCGGSSDPVKAGGREAKEWVAALGDKSPKVRRQAVLKLGNLGDADPSVAEGLLLALGDSDATVRFDAVAGVYKLTKPGEAIVAKLQAMAGSDRDPRVRDAARRVAEKFAGAG